MSELILLRHAEPESAGLYIGRGSDPPLSPHGREEAERIASILSISEDVPEVVYSSPLKRAKETVEPLAQLLGQRIEIAEGLEEMDFGEWEGLSWQEIQERGKELWQAWLDNPWRISPPGGETLENLQDRVICNVEAIMESSHPKTILIASHGGPIRAVLGYTLNLDPGACWSVGIDYASLCRFSRRRGAAMELLQWNVPIKSGSRTGHSD